MKINEEIIEAFKKSINEESSDRAKVIIMVAQIDHLFDLKLKEFYSKGNKDARKKLFSEGGPFSSFSSKVNIAFCSGWIDSDIYHDIEQLRKIRNCFAHGFENLTLNSPTIRKYVENFIVPHREYSDLGKLKAAAVENGFLLYTGEKPKEGKESLIILGNLLFGLSASIIYAVLLENPRFKIELSDGKITDIHLLKHMKHDK